MENYLASCYQRTEVSDAYSSRSVAGVPQGLILWSFLFKTFWTDLFLNPEEIGNFLSNYAEDDNFNAK